MNCASSRAFTAACRRCARRPQTSPSVSPRPFGSFGAEACRRSSKKKTTAPVPPDAVVTAQGPQTFRDDQRSEGDPVDQGANRDSEIGGASVVFNTVAPAPKSYAELLELQLCTRCGKEPAKADSNLGEVCHPKVKA